MENQDLKRAKFAAEKAKGQNEDYKNSVKKMIPLVQSGGVIAALAYAKGKDANKEVYNNIVEWLKIEGKISSNENRAISELVEKNSLEILHITKETMAVLSWLKRMADALIIKQYEKKETK